MRPLTPLMAKIEPPSSTRQRCRLRPGSPSSPRQREEDIDLAAA